MTVSELRIGNLVYNDSEVKRITALDLLNLEESEARSAGCFLSPITLTEEWLVKFGFNCLCNEIEGVIPFSIINDNIYSDGFKCIITIGSKSKRIFYVHELQNIVHSLTGEELTC